jgi:hypothetical protein
LKIQRQGCLYVRHFLEEVREIRGHAQRERGSDHVFKILVLPVFLHLLGINENGKMTYRRKNLFKWHILLERKSWRPRAIFS